MKGRIAAATALVLFVALGTRLDALGPAPDPLAGLEPERLGDWAAVRVEAEGLEMFSWTDGDRFIVNTADGRREFVAGVNLGVTIPGHFPGELAVPAETYRRWFPQMAAVGFTAIRVYTMLEPHFYEELRAYNTTNPERPLYLVHGAWPDEPRFLETGDLWETHVVDTFERELSDLVDVVYGDATIAERPGRAGGVYTADVSPWLLAWAVGIEWDPEVVRSTDRLHADTNPHTGDYIVADQAASPTESWMARMLDHLAARLAARGSTMPLGFVNWTTTDPLTHPDEPNPKEDMAAIDPMRLTPTEAWPGGYFAGYHVYPYYPDFQRFEDGVADFEWRGEPDAFAGLLTKLADHHDGVPLVVLEYGVPSGMAKAHDGPQDRDQGDHPEQRQAEINARLLEVIGDLGLAGGYQFAWADEWFKLTWNTMDFEPFARRPLWMNAWTNEAHFGIVAVEPGPNQEVVLDGDGAEWESISQAILESEGPIREIRATHDEGYLYLRIVTDRPQHWISSPITVAFDVMDGDAGGLPDLASASSPADYAIRFDDDSAQLLVRSSADPLLRQYRHHGYLTPEPGELDEGNGRWNLHRLMTNRPQTVPSTGRRLPVEIDDVGTLHHGTTDPTSRRFDSRATWYAEDRLIEARIPWQGIGFADPSSRLAYVVDDRGRVDFVPVDRLEIDVETDGVVTSTAGYEWSGWNAVEYHERIKAGTHVFGNVVVDLNARVASG